MSKLIFQCIICSIFLVTRLRFEQINSPVYLKVFVFHAQNTSCGNDFANMQLTERGPYVFEEKRFKDNVDYSIDNEFVVYNQRKSYTFREDLSNGRHLNDSVSVINFPLLGLIHNVGSYAFYQFESQITEIRKYNTKYQPLKNELQLFINTTVGELLFDGIAYALLGGSRFGIFYGSEGADNNRTEDESWMVYTGNKSVANYLEVKMYADYEKIKGYPKSKDLWHDEYAITEKDGRTYSCNDVRGTDGTQFSPSLTRDKHRLYVFDPQVCRVTFFDYESEVRVNDTTAYRYRIPREYYDSPKLSPNNRCYCNEPANDFEKCSVSGVLDIAYCNRQTSGAPIIVSAPYFLYGGGYYNKLVGLRYSDQSVTVEKYGTYLDIDPITGAVLNGERNIQLNVKLHSSSAVPELNNLTQNIVVPLIWMSEVFG